MRSIRITCLMALILCLVFSGCGKEDVKDAGSFKLYFINQKQTALVPIAYKLSSEGTMEAVQEVLDVLSTTVEDSDHTCPITDKSLIQSYKLKSGKLTLSFGMDYTKLSSVREVLMRSAIVKSLVQIDGVNSVSFKVGEDALTDYAGNVIGAMTDETFVYDFGQEQDTLESAELVLYYAGVDAGSLIKERRKVYYNGNVPLEQVVMRYLTMQPQTIGASPVISDVAKVLSVSTLDGICYVNLDDTVFSNSEELSTNIIVYSIVNSLCELDGIGQVEIMIGTGENASVLPGPDGNDLYQSDERLVKE